MISHKKMVFNWTHETGMAVLISARKLLRKIDENFRDELLRLQVGLSEISEDDIKEKAASVRLYIFISELLALVDKEKDLSVGKFSTSEEQ